MSARSALKNGTVLCFRNSAGGEVKYTIVREIRRGASCIVYDASYLTNAGDQKTVRIKECYPFRLRIERNAFDLLSADPDDKKAFEEAQKRFVSDFTTVNSLVRQKSMYDEVASTIDIYHANGTVYLVSVFTSDLTLDCYHPSDIQECISIVRQTAVSIGSLHEAGYLYLDVKPENILLIEGNLEYPRAQLFDFDSLIPYQFGELVLLRHRYKLSFSKGYAAIELQTGQIRKIGRHTDVYGIAALLFRLLFGRTPSAHDSETGSSYPFEKMIYSTSEYSDNFLNALSDFFHHSLANYYRDRFRDMNEVVHILGKLYRLADRKTPYVLYTNLTSPAEITGRKDELAFLKKWYEDVSSRCLFVSGMGGIGKSTLVRWFLFRQMKNRVRTIYLNWKGSIAETITDDCEARINAVSRLSQETAEEYFKRKLTAYRSILAGTDTVLVIDNFEIQNEQEIGSIMDVGWKIILICRNLPSVCSIPVCHVREFGNDQEYIELFSSVLQRCISEEEIEAVKRIAAMVHGHTLVLELIAKHIQSASLSVQEEEKRIDSVGFSAQDDPVAYEKDDGIRITTIRNIITALFDGSALSLHEKSMLQMLSLSGDSGISEKFVASVLGYSCGRELGILAGEGWIARDRGMVTVHPVIRETVQLWPWEKASMELYRKFVSFLCTVLKTAERKEDRPGRKPKVNRLISRVMKFSPVSRQFLEDSTINSNYDERYEKELRKEGSREKGDSDAFAMCQLLGEQAVYSSRRIRCLSKDDRYHELLYYTMAAAPRHHEEYILTAGKELIAAQYMDCPDAVIRSYEKVIETLEEQQRYREVLHELKSLKKYAEKNGSSYHLARYYSAAAGYFDYLTEGDYQTCDPEHEDILTALLQSLQKSVRFASKSRHPDAMRLIADGKLAIAAILLRNNPSQRKKIRKLLSEASYIVKAYCLPYSETSFICQTVFAWYYTLAEPDLYLTAKALSRAMKIEQVRNRDDLDLVDEFLVPAADIYRNHEHYDEAEHFIRIALNLCEKHADAEPYRRKIEMLKGCLKDLREEADNTSVLTECSSIPEKEVEYDDAFAMELREFIRTL